ncbi:flippase [Halobacterium rubrum]|uniref:flippase n=1 Tax=Halobacterium TaxID=2239 RepID=UPI001F176269|nr:MULTISPECIES: flippase [Halobacterium]MDH5021371.1 flippase [Halobacterium rubrum]
MRYGRTSVISFLSKLTVSFSGFFGTVVLTRFLGREQFGAYVVVMSVLAWAAVAGNLGIGAALKKRVSEDDGVDYVIPGVITQLFLFGAVAIILWLIRPILNDYMGIQATGIVIALLLVKLSVGLVWSILDGQHMVHISSLLQPFQKTVQSIVQIILVLAGLGLAGAFAGYLFGAVATTVVGAYFVNTRFTTPSIEDFKRLKSYAQFSWFAHIRGQTFMSMDTLILAVFLTNSVVGGYKAAWNLASIFATFSVAIQRTLFPEMSSLASRDNKSEVTSLLREGLTYSGLIIVPGVVGSALLGDIILRVYGEGFASGYYILIILSIARLIYGYQSQLLNTIDALDRPELTFRINVVFVTLNLILNFALTANFGWYGAAFATALSALVGTILGYSYLSNLIEVPIPKREIANQILASGVMAAVVLPNRLYFENTIPLGILLSGLGALAYFLTLLIISVKFRKTVNENIPYELPMLPAEELNP